MRSIVTKLAVLVSIGILGALFSPMSFSATPPELVLSDGLGNSVTIDATGAATCVGTCTTSSSSAAFGSVNWSGTLGVFTVNTATGNSKPVLTPPQIRVSLLAQTGAGGGTLTLKWSDVGFDGSGPSTMTAAITPAGSSSATFTSYVDDTNTLFGTGTTVGTLGPLNASNAFGTANGLPGPTAQPFSMTNVVAVTLGPTSSMSLNFSLMDQPVPPLALTCASATTGQVGTPYDSFLTASGGVPPYNFSIISGSLPPGLTLNSSTGEIKGTPTSAGSFSFTAQVTDSSGNTTTGTATSQCTIVISPAPLAVFCSGGTGQVNVPYSSSLSATGGVKPYMFSIVGSLPPGLTLNASTGLISGTPTMAGSFTFTAVVTDSSGNTGSNTATSQCTIVIAPPTTNVCGLTWGYWKNHVSAWPVTSLVLGSQTYSQAELITILGMAVKGDESISLAHQLIAAKLNVANGTNPATAGGNISAADALLSQFSGKLPYNVAPSSAIGQQMTTVESALDDFNSDGKLQPGCSGTSAPPPISLVCAANTGTVGVAYSSSLVVSGGVAPYTFSLMSGSSLPPGLMLNASTGAITGVPTSAGTYTFTAVVTDSTGTSNGTTATTCTITIAPPPPPAPLALQCAAATGQVGLNYSSALVATGGVPPYTYSISSGSLPPGLVLNPSTGAITGIPTTSGNFNFTAKVVDSSGNVGSNTVTSQCGISISPAPSGNSCGLTWGYWKNHTNIWGASSLVLGSQTYNKSELITILQTAVKGDASIDLAHQLIAAKLNVLNGTNIATAGNNISSADALLAQFPGKLPYGVSPSSSIGTQMTAISSNLDDFNSDGKLQPGCVSTSN